jgi:hypothetical protein
MRVLIRRHNIAFAESEGRFVLISGATLARDGETVTAVISDGAASSLMRGDGARCMHQGSNGYVKPRSR